LLSTVHSFLQFVREKYYSICVTNGHFCLCELARRWQREAIELFSEFRLLVVFNAPTDIAVAIRTNSSLLVLDKR